jgi:hypothetical protein
MAEDDRTFRTSTPAANRAEMQGLGVGQKEMDAQRAPSREQHATDPRRPEPFENDAARTGERGRSFDDRDTADLGEDAEFGAGTPAGVDVHDIGNDDNPQEDWGDATDEGMMHSANHTRRPIKTEAERGQGRKTRAATKDIISRRTK